MTYGLRDSRTRSERRTSPSKGTVSSQREAKGLPRNAFKKQFYAAEYQVITSIRWAARLSIRCAVTSAHALPPSSLCAQLDIAHESISLKSKCKCKMQTQQGLENKDPAAMAVTIIIHPEMFSLMMRGYCMNWAFILSPNPRQVASALQSKLSSSQGHPNDVVLLPSTQQ